MNRALPPKAASGVATTSPAERRYWRRTLVLTAVLLLVWVATGFLPGWYADELNRIEFFGWPLGFYLSAQGALIVFLVLVWIYDHAMRRIERGLRRDAAKAPQ